MDCMPEKSRLILEHEQHFASVLAGKVLDKPKLDIWMFLLPILFVYYMNDFKKFKDGSKAFAAHYMITQKRALEEAVAVVQSGKTADPYGLTKQSGISAEAQKKLAELFAVLIGHYEILLKAVGGDFDSLVRSAYNNLTNYLLFINQLNNAEKKLNMALKPQFATAAAGVNDIISAMETYTEQIRRKEAHDIFS
jgi:hypothetical protein